MQGDDWAEFVKRGLALFIPTGIGIAIWASDDWGRLGFMGFFGWFLAGAIAVALLMRPD